MRKVATGILTFQNTGRLAEGRTVENLMKIAEAAKALQARPPRDTKVVGRDLVEIPAAGPAQVLHSAQADPSAFGRDLQAAGINPASAEGRALLNKQFGPQVSIQNVTEVEEAELASAFVNDLETEELPTTAKQLAQVDLLEQLFNEGLETSAIEEISSRTAAAFGFKSTANQTRLEAARSLINSIITAKIGEATFGSLSEGERAFLAATTADVSITTEANRARLELAKRILAYEQELKIEMSRYAKAHKTTAGLAEHMRAWSKRPPAAGRR